MSIGMSAPINIFKAMINGMDDPTRLKEEIIRFKKDYDKNIINPALWQPFFKPKTVIKRKSNLNHHNSISLEFPMLEAELKASNDFKPKSPSNIHRCKL